MKILNIKFISILLLSVFLYSCETEEVQTTIVSQPEFQTQNGYFNFKSINEYRKVYEKISSLNSVELENWRSKLPFKTLEAKYEKEGINMYILDNTTDDFNYKLNTKRVNSILASLYNENGVMVINDTIYKIKDEYQYTIANGDFTLLEKIDNNCESDCKSIQKQKHTISLEPTKNTNPEGLQKVISDRTLVFYTSATTREFVTFEGYVSGGFIRFEMTGQYQDKFIVWLPNVKDELVYGKIDSRGTWNNQIVNTNNPYFYNEDSKFVYFYIGSPAMITFDLDVTYSYKKTNATAYINEWKGTLNSTEGSFTRNYKSINF